MAILLAIAVAFLSQDGAAADVPTLHRRAIYESATDPAKETADAMGGDQAIATWERGAAAVPRESSGFYRFRDRAQGVQIVSNSGKVSGYLLKLAEGASDKGMVLGYYFSEVSATDDKLWFRTTQVHGVWYGFEGQIVQGRGGEAGMEPGRGLSPWSDGNYILEGTLTMHDEFRQTTRRDAVRLTSSGHR
jgi:hypothetical protein